MKVLLIAKPPMGDKVADALRALGVDLDYKRGISEHAMASAVRPGVQWVLAMNTEGQGVAIKERARKCQARFVSIPPSWTFTERKLQEEHFFAALTVEHTRQERDAKLIGGQGNGLTYRPFENLAAPEPEPSEEFIEAAADELENVPAKVETIEVTVTDVSPPQPVPPIPRPVTPPRLQHPPIAVPKESPKMPAPSTEGLSHAELLKSPNKRIREGAEKRQFLIALFDAVPGYPPNDAQKMVEKRWHSGISASELYYIRRLRAEMAGVEVTTYPTKQVANRGTPSLNEQHERSMNHAKRASDAIPRGSLAHLANGSVKPTKPFKMPPPPSAAPEESAEPETVLADGGSLPPDVEAAAELLAKAMRDANLLGWITVKPGEYEAEIQVMRKLAIKSKV